MSQSISAKSLDKAFQQEVVTALEGKQDVEATQKNQQMLSTEGELDEQALDNVAGGGDGGGRRH